jgi:hypothetical protein
MSILKNHPFSVEAFFDKSTVLTYAFPKEALEHLLPASLSLDLFQDKWAFVAIALVQTTGLRPKGFPAFMGNDFYLIGYRIFVQYTDSRGKRLRGLYILKSETDSKKMEIMGNIFTHYNYTTTDIRDQTLGDGSREISSLQSKFAIVINAGKDEVALPSNSPFQDWKEARRFAGPLPFTFTVDETKKETLIIEGVRENWVPKAIEVSDEQVDFIEHLTEVKGVLANAFEISNIPYYWKKGRVDPWK